MQVKAAPGGAIGGALIDLGVLYRAHDSILAFLGPLGARCERRFDQGVDLSLTKEISAFERHIIIIIKPSDQSISSKLQIRGLLGPL